jgi:hypothetical protein
LIAAARISWTPKDKIAVAELVNKSIAKLTPEDFTKSPVWSFFEDNKGVIKATPVSRLPVRSLAGRLIGCQVQLANGRKVWAELSNIHLHNERSTSQFLTLSVFRDSERFNLARYFDVDYSRRGPNALANFLGLHATEVFPIKYEISKYVTGATIRTSGEILAEPTVRLSQEELLKLSLE